MAECSHDARPFVLTMAHLEGRLRELNDEPVQHLPPGFESPLCDFCSSKGAGLAPAATVTAGMRQATCPVCHTEFLSDG